MRSLPGRNTPYQPLEDWVPALDGALDHLDQLRPADKQRLVGALATIVTHDGTLELAEAELLRAICGSLHCPLPPFVDEASPTASESGGIGGGIPPAVQGHPTGRGHAEIG
jgi:hypothetical protein